MVALLRMMTSAEVASASIMQLPLRSHHQLKVKMNLEPSIRGLEGLTKFRCNLDVSNR